MNCRYCGSAPTRSKGDGRGILPYLRYLAFLCLAVKCGPMLFRYDEFFGGLIAQLGDISGGDGTGHHHEAHGETFSRIVACCQANDRP